MIQTLKFTFRKDEKLCSRKIIESLFESGTSSNEFPFRFIWRALPLPLPVPAQAAFIVPKRLYKHAVDRNRIKRRMREIYRHHKHAMLQMCLKTNKQVALVFIYNGKNQLEYREMESKIILILHRLVETLQADDQ